MTRWVPRSGLKWLELALFAAAFLLIFGQVLRLATGDNDIAPALWGFVVAGLSLLLPRYLALFFWHRVRAHVESATLAGDVVNVTMAYEISGRSLTAQISETTSLKPGDPVTLYVNPIVPEDYFALTSAPQLIGWAMVVLCSAVLASGDTLVG